MPTDADTELRMRKRDGTVKLSVAIDGDHVFYAEPEVGRSQQAMKAAIQTFVGRAFNAELDDADTEDAFQ